MTPYPGIPFKFTPPFEESLAKLTALPPGIIRQCTGLRIGTSLFLVNREARLGRRAPNNDTDFATIEVRTIEEHGPPSPQLVEQALRALADSQDDLPECRLLTQAGILCYAQYFTDFAKDAPLYRPDAEIEDYLIQNQYP